MDRQLHVDFETLQRVVPAIERLEAEWKEARVSVAARSRGYFTPDEEDRVRQILLAYRNYRFALYEIISRGYGYRDIADPERRLRIFLLALGAALTVYAKSLKLIQTYEREPLVRKKLNEPDAKFDLGPGFFEEVLRGYSSPWNYRGLIKAAWFWRANRRAIQKLPPVPNEDWHWLLDLIRHQLGVVRRRLLHVLACRLRYDWRSFGRTVFQPLRNTQYSLRAQIAGACANIRTTLHYEPALKPDILARLHRLLQPGDVLLMRAEQKLTSAILPGFWAHAALFCAGAGELERLGIADEAPVSKHRHQVVRHDAGQGCVIEAISPRVQINALGVSLCADHVMVLRSRLAPGRLREVLLEAFQHVDKPYDFEFDFNVSTRIVCTELIYRCFHKRDGIEFALIKRLGRYTLSGDDIMNQWLDSVRAAPGPGKCPFDLVALVLKRGGGSAEFVDPDQAVAVLRKIQSGWRPTTLASASTADAVFKPA
jgi:hypothetical protein